MLFLFSSLKKGHVEKVSLRRVPFDQYGVRLQGSTPALVRKFCNSILTPLGVHEDNKLVCEGMTKDIHQVFPVYASKPILVAQPSTK